MSKRWTGPREKLSDGCKVGIDRSVNTLPTDATKLDQDRRLMLEEFHAFIHRLAREHASAEAARFDAWYVS